MNNQISGCVLGVWLFQILHLRASKDLCPLHYVTEFNRVIKGVFVWTFSCMIIILY